MISFKICMCIHLRDIHNLYRIYITHENVLYTRNVLYTCNLFHLYTCKQLFIRIYVCLFVLQFETIVFCIARTHAHTYTHTPSHTHSRTHTHTRTHIHIPICKKETD